MNGFFLVLDGIDGAGKSTHLAFIQEFLANERVETIYTREPGGTPLSERLRDILLNKNNTIHPDTETLLMFAARSQHLQQLIYPALNTGKWVISDRFTDASYAYQSGGRQMPDSRIATIENWVQGDFRPDMTIIFDVPVAVSQERVAKARQKDRFEQEDPEFFERVRQAYLRQAAKNPKRYAVIDSNQDKEMVQNHLQHILCTCLKQWRANK
ncbi:MAG: dTMP kinase [Neisseriaceae bacterium]|nr:dTMP kinase [Neisseriaceae bacterium]